MKRSLMIFSILFLLGVGVFAQCRLAESSSVKSPSIRSGVLASIGGLRSVVSEVIWFRMDKLQRESRYAELAQLASMLTSLDPHNVEVWSYSAWNLAYNVSFSMPNDESRWHWVKTAMEMLRDEALVWNPDDPDICYEIAHLFEMKIGYEIDMASPYYREEWRKIVEDTARRDAWEELAMDRATMAEVEELYGVDDWGNPLTSSIYWAHRGLAKSDDRSRMKLEGLIQQAKMLYNKSYNKEDTL